MKEGKADEIFRNINRREKAKGNANVAFEIVIEMDDGSELVVKRTWTAGAVSEPKPRDLTERLVVVRDGKRVSVQNQEIWQDFIRAAIPPGITQFFFFDGEKIQEIAADDHSEVRLKSSLEAALSAGEKEVFAVSLLWGLAQTSELKLPIIIDTPLSRLDSTHRDNIVNNYFPNAGEQVIILSTDTEIDTNYYRSLKPRLSGAASLEFDQRQELTTFRQGYFWEKNNG